MTLLHKLVTVAEGGAAHIHNYFVSHDSNSLQQAVEGFQGLIKSLQDEMQNPSLQRGVIRLGSLTAAQFETRMAVENAAVIESCDYVLDGPALEVGKLARVVATDQPESSAFLARVTLIQPNLDLVLAPVVMPQ